MIINQHERCNPAHAPTNPQVWLLRGRKSGELRAVVINKHDARECGADIRLSAEQLGRYAQQATGRYMYVSGGLSDRWDFAQTARGGAVQQGGALPCVQHLRVSKQLRGAA